MPVQPARPQPEGAAAEIFDRAHLAHYTLNSAELEREIIGLFLQQLPSTIELIEQAVTAAEWKLATHTLKGAAAAVGAKRLLAIAVELEGISANDDQHVKPLRLKLLRHAAAEFRDAVKHIHP